MIMVSIYSYFKIDYDYCNNNLKSLCFLKGLFFLEEIEFEEFCFDEQKKIGEVDEEEELVV